MLKGYLSRVIAGERFTREEAARIMERIMSGQPPPEQVAGLLTALAVRPPTPHELAGFIDAMSERCIRVPVSVPVMDLCGTGGAPLKGINVSTLSAFVVSACGVPVAKHGNRSVTSSCGSADLLEALGADITLPPERMKGIIEETGVGFMFAPLYHPAMKAVAPVRRVLGIRTVFNLLGPMLNPAGVRIQMLGVHSEGLMRSVAETLTLLGRERFTIVHGIDGMDEVSVVGWTRVMRYSGDGLEEGVFHPHDVGMPVHPSEVIRRGDAETAVRAGVKAILGRPGWERDMLVLNSAFALHTWGAVDDLKEGVDAASEAVESGRAIQRLELFIRRTGGDVERFRSLVGEVEA